MANPQIVTLNIPILKTDEALVRRFAEVEGLTLSQLFKRAIEAEAIIFKAHAAGNKVIVVDKKGRPLSEIV